MMTQLEECNALYDLRATRLAQEANQLSTEEVLQRVDSLACIAHSLSPSRLADPEIERLLLERGKSEWASLPLPPASRTSRRKILHVSTEIYSVGGHTRIIARWIKLDKNSDHAVVLTRQSVPVPEWFSDVMKASRSELLELDTTKSRLQRARSLRQFAAERNVTHVVLHHFASDSIPLIAFATEGGPPVLIYNHADNLFWSGPSIADAIIDYCSVSSHFSLKYRGARNSLYLPLVIDEAVPFIERPEAKRRLGLPPETVLLVSIGRKSKYVPWRHLNFFSTYGKLLNCVPNATLIVIGVSDADQEELLITQKPSNIILAGEVIDASLYAMAADIYLDGFPIGAGVGACEMCRFGAAPLFAYGKAPTIHEAQGRPVFEDCLLPPRFETEAEQIQFALQLCQDKNKRDTFGKAIATFIRSRSVGENWLAYLEKIYTATDGLDHRVITDYKMELLPTALCADINGYGCRDRDSVLFSLMMETRKTASLRDLRDFALRLSKSRVRGRRLLRGVRGVLGFFGRSLVAAARRPGMLSSTPRKSGHDGNGGRQFPSG